ncbi:MAG: hypothetical protein RIT28_3965 [Pseudomonadota bacterium]
MKWLHVGHIHLFDHSVAGGHHPPQTVSGGGGTALNGSSQCVDSNTQDCLFNQYTYMAVSTQSSAWGATVYDQNGTDMKIPFSVNR